MHPEGAVCHEMEWLKAGSRHLLHETGAASVQQTCTCSIPIKVLLVGEGRELDTVTVKECGKV